MSRFVIGVDGGGTCTRVSLVDEEGAHIGTAEGPASLVHRGGGAASAAVVAATSGAAARAAGVDFPAEHLWAGLAGVGNPRDSEVIRAALESAGVATRVTIGSDAEAAFHDAFEGGPGILVISGTGSIVLARGAEGEAVRVGGWGVLLGDEGSGYSIGIAALKAVVRGEDGRSIKTLLRDPILGAVGVTRPSELVHWVSAATKAEIAGLVTLVERAAGDDDPAATEIIESAVEALIGHVLTAMRRLGPWPGRPTVALSGGLLNPGGPLRKRFMSAAAGIVCHPLEREVKGVHGAASLALAALES